MKDPARLAPARAPVERDRANAPILIGGLAKLFEQHTLDGWQEPDAALGNPLAEYDAFIRIEVLPVARTDLKLPADLCMRPPRLLNNTGEMGEFVLPLNIPAPVSLQLRLMRAARAFLDPELHLGRVTPDEAQRVLREDVVLSAGMTEQEVERYMVRSPGQVVLAHVKVQ
jgi:hypothetical protein